MLFTFYTHAVINNQVVIVQYLVYNAYIKYIKRVGIVMAEKNNFKNNRQPITKEVYEERINEQFSHADASGECLSLKTGINSSIESGDTYPIDTTLMTGNSNKEGGEK